MSTMTSPIISNIKISDMARSQQPAQKVNFSITDVQVADEVNEYGKVQVNVYFGVDLNGKHVTINKRLNIKPDTFTAENSQYIKGLLTRFAQSQKELPGVENKDARKARFTTDEWRDLWAYSFDVDQILNPLFKLAKLESPEFHQLVGITGNCSVERDQKGFLTVTKVNGRAK